MQRAQRGYHLRSMPPIPVLLRLLAHSKDQPDTGISLLPLERSSVEAVISNSPCFHSTPFALGLLPAHFICKLQTRQAIPRRRLLASPTESPRASLRPPSASRP